MSGIPHELPSEAIPAAVGVFTYSFICLILSFGLLWATLAHGEYTSCEFQGPASSTECLTGHRAELLGHGY